MDRGALFSTRLMAALMVFAGPCQAQDILDNRPAFSLGDHPAKSFAQCDQVRPMSENLPDPGFRIDLSATGKLTLVRTDGALWYLVICSDVRIMCITYQSNGMEVGDVVKMQGAYQRIDPNHVLLDPCLAQSSQ